MIGEALKENNFMKQFEYLTRYIEVGIFNNDITNEKYQETILNNLNELGSYGWELVNCTPITSHLGAYTLIMFFKREK